jgi:hypothetical protein
MGGVPMAIWRIVYRRSDENFDQVVHLCADDEGEFAKQMTMWRKEHLEDEIVATQQLGDHILGVYQAAYEPTEENIKQVEKQRKDFWKAVDENEA